MTSNQVAYMNAKTKQEELEENKRHNLEGEKIDKFSAVTSAISGALPRVSFKGKIPDFRAAKANDPEWYKLNPELYKQNSKLAFSTIAGLPHSVDDQIGGSSAEDTDILGTGITVLEYYPTIGGAVEKVAPTSGINDIKASPAQISAQQAYTANRKTNSGAKNYDPSDQFLYEYAVTMAYAQVALIQRGLGLVQFVNGRNRTFWSRIAKAMGYDFDSYANNIANAVKKLNSAILRLNSFPVRDTLTVLLRQTWMNANYFADSASSKAQYYAFVNRYYYTYEETSGAGYLKANTRFARHSVNTLETDLSHLETMIQKLAASQDVGTIGGDLEKAFKDPDNKVLYGHRLVYPTISDIAPLPPVYSPEVLGQIHNCNIMAIDPAIENPIDIKQDGNGIIYQGVDLDALDNPSRDVVTRFKYGVVVGKLSRNNARPNLPVLNSHHEDPTDDDVVVDTRLKAWAAFNGLPDAEDPSMYTSHQVLAYCGTEAIDTVSTYYVDMDGSDKYFDFSRSAVTDAATEAFAKEVSVISGFDWYPMLLCRYGSNSDAFVIGDLDNFVILDEEWLKHIHEVCVYSELGVRFESLA